MEFPTYEGVEVLRLPPPGVDVDFNDRTPNPAIQATYIITGVGMSLAFIALMQRYYTKIFLAKGLQLDDYLMLGGWMCSVITQTVQIASIAEQGFCYNSYEMPLVHFERYALKSYIAAPIYQLCNGLVKLSLLTFYLHISPQRWFRVSVWVNIVIVLLYTVVIAALFYFNCIPPRKQFDLKVEGDCFDPGPLYMATAVSNIVTDIILLALPIPMVYQLHMPRMQKVGAVIVFGIGSVTIGTSVLRLVVLPPLLNSDNPSYDGCTANIWTHLEANLFIICGSMPTLRKFFKHFAPKLMGTSRNGSATGTSHTYGQRSTNARTGGSTTLRSARKSQHPYLHFAEDEDGSDDHELQNFSRNASEPTTTVGVASSDPQRDDHSEKAILQTKSFTIQYNDR